MAPTVGIAGITGKFARSVVQNLLEKPDVKIRGYCRDPSKLPPLFASSPRIQITKGESNDVTALRSFVKDCDVVMCGYLGDNNLMTEGQKALIDACEAEGVPRYIASDYTLDYRKLEYGQLVSKDPMRHVEEYLRNKRVQGVHVLIGIFMETFWSHFFQLWNEKEMKISYWGTGSEKYESTTYSNAAKFVAAICLNPQAIGFQEILGDRRSILEIADDFEIVYGKRPRLERLGSLDDLYENMHKTQKQNPKNCFSYLPMFYQYYCIDGQHI